MPRRTTARQRSIFIASMLIFGTLAPFVRGINVSSAEIALCRAVMAAAVTGIFLLVIDRKIPFKEAGKEIVLLLLSGAAMGFNWVLLFEAYRFTSVAYATLSYYFAPVIVAVASPLLFREKTGARQVICFCGATAGLVLITLTGASSGRNDLVGILLGLGAAVLYATVMLINKMIRSVGGIERTFLQFIAASAAVLPYVLSTGGFHPQQLDSKGWILLLVVCLFHTGFTYCLYFSSMGALSGNEVSILGYLDPLTALIISVIFLNEHMSLVQLAGAVMILGFSLLNGTGGDKEE